jgi:hypothetical protein
VLKIAAALGIGSLAGGGAASKLVGSAAAQADTSDSDGNVGLPGDRVDVFADGVDAAGPVEAPSVSTDDASVTNAPTLSTIDDETRTVFLKPDTSATVSGLDAISATDATKVTTGVSTTATTIMPTNVRSALHLVHGQGVTDTSERFLDLILHVQFGDVVVIGSAGGNSPPSRTYTDSTGDLQLAMASNEFDVVVKQTMMRVQ